MQEKVLAKFKFVILFFTLTILNYAQPVISQHPTNQSVVEGSTATFSVLATGSGTITYQWYINGSSIVGATSNIYTTPPVILDDNGSVFHCDVTDSNGTTSSNGAVLNVTAGTQPEITAQPTDKTIYVGETATFSIGANGTQPLQFQWKKNNVDIDGANSNSYTTPAATINDNGTLYSCVVSNNFGTQTSTEVTLTVLENGVRVSNGIQVLYEFNEQGGEVIHDVSGNGTPEDITLVTPDKAAWTPKGLATFYNNIARRTETDSKLRASCVASNEISLEVWIKPDFVPQNAKRIFTYSLSGAFRNFSIIADGDHYEFRLTTTSTDLNGLPSLSSSSGTQTNELTHLVYTRSSDGTAKVYINGELNVSGYIPGDLTRFKDYCYLAVGSEPLGGNDWIGLHYLAAVYDRALSETEVQHNYSIGTPVDNKPAFTHQPQNQFVVEGEDVVFDSYAVSVLPLTYQWKKNSVSIQGATNRKLNLSAVTSSDNGAIFTCTATTEAGTTTSTSAELFVTSLGGRVTHNLVAYYTFREGTGNKIRDISGYGTAADLTIFSTNSVEWNSNGLKINSEPSILTTAPVQKISDAVKANSEITVEAWVMPISNSQTGPASIFNYSTDADSKNFSLAQNSNNYEMRLRTTSTNNNGEPAINTEGVTANDFDHIVYTKDNDGNVTIYLNGTIRTSEVLGGDFSNWEGRFLSIGNEVGGGYPWLGTINLLAVYDRALSEEEVSRNYEFGAYAIVKAPSNLVIVSNEIGKVGLSWDDNSHNEDGFEIERSLVSPENFQVIGTLPKDSISFVDTTIVDNNYYQYRVKAYYSLGVSEYSNSVQILTLIRPIEEPSDISYSYTTDGYPILTWIDNSNNESGFKIERRLTSSGSNFTLIDSVSANITEFTDYSVNDSTSYIYRIFAFNPDTTSAYSGEKFVEVLTNISLTNEIPNTFDLKQNYPNPFNPTTKIKFSLPEKSNVNLSIFNMLGQKIGELLNRDFAAGYYEHNFNATEYPSGIYLYSIVATSSSGKSFKNTKKMILIK